MSNVYMHWYNNGDTFNIADALVPDYATSNYAVLALQEVFDQQGNLIGSKVAVTGGSGPPLPPLLPPS